MFCPTHTGIFCSISQLRVQVHLIKHFTVSLICLLNSDTACKGDVCLDVFGLEVVSEKFFLRYILLSIWDRLLSRLICQLS